MIRDIVYPAARLVFDTTKPDGTPRKLLDVTRLATLGWKHNIQLRDGIAATYKWFLATGGKGLRDGSTAETLQSEPIAASR
jgi:GDP-L-fucose synthase